MKEREKERNKVKRINKNTIERPRSQVLVFLSSQPSYVLDTQSGYVCPGDAPTMMYEDLKQDKTHPLSPFLVYCIVVDWVSKVQ